MSKFIAPNGIISKANSTITGSLRVSGQITASYLGTASFVTTASYSINSATSEYTLATSIDSASYATTVVSSSISDTASIMTNPGYGPTPGIGWISPNIHANFGVLNSTFLRATASLNYGGTLFFPFMINKDCTLVTMSVLGGVSNNTTCSLAIYSNSTASSLPEYLLVTGSFRVTALNTNTVAYHATNFTSIKLYSNNVYWIAHTSNAVAGNYTFRLATLTSNQCPSYNPLLGYAVTTAGTTTANFMYPMWCLRSASFSETFPLTASQLTTSYLPPSGAWGAFGLLNQLAAPYLKVIYP